VLTRGSYHQFIAVISTLLTRGSYHQWHYKWKRNIDIIYQVACRHFVFDLISFPKIFAQHCFPQLSETWHFRFTKELYCGFSSRGNHNMKTYKRLCAQWILHIPIFRARKMLASLLLHTQFLFRFVYLYALWKLKNLYLFQLYAPQKGNLVLQVVRVLSVMILAQQSSVQGTVHWVSRCC
jgi:hypothetical protein